MSFIYTTNKSGPRIDPWGTPLSTHFQSEYCPFRVSVPIIYIYLYSSKNDSNQTNRKKNKKKLDSERNIENDIHAYIT